ncbi:MAG: plastocyanin/azurin family copper-binding protein [Halobacteriaceae archaeon]
MKRRDFLRAASGGAAVSATAGAAQATAPPDSGALPARESGTTASNASTTTAPAAPNGTATPNGTAAPNGSGEPTTAAPSGTTHTVEMGSTSFNPSSITIAPGDTVKWSNTSSLGHTVTAYGDKIPEGAAYFASGGFDSEQAARDAYASGDPSTGFIPPGETYTHTFTTTGTYEYFCIPHEAAGMKGTVEVVEGGGGDGGGGGHGALSPHEMGVPFQAHFVGIATVLMMLVSLVYTFFVVKYGSSPHASSPNRRD